MTDAVREILHTKRKFISLLIMNFLAVGFLAGLRMTAPDMKHSLDVYYDEQNLMDLRIVSTLGMTQDDIDALKNLSDEPGLVTITDAEGSKYLDALIGEDTVTVFSLPEKINRLRLTQGRLPRTAVNVLSGTALADKLGIGIGDTISINTDDADKTDDGVQRAEGAHLYGRRRGDQPDVYHLRQEEIRASAAGHVTAWVSVPEEVFTQDYYTAVYLTADELILWNAIWIRTTRTRRSFKGSTETSGQRESQPRAAMS